MLSRRDKLYVQPWEERRFQDHRSKVRTALPAIDDRAPPPRAHVAVKLKKWQREAERARKVQRDNFSLLQRLQAIMRSKRLDNWLDKQNNFRHKVGMFYPAEALRGRLAARARQPPPAAAADCAGAGAEAGGAQLKCFACYTKRKTVLQLNKVYSSDSTSLPSI